MSSSILTVNPACVNIGPVLQSISNGCISLIFPRNCILCKTYCPTINFEVPLCLNCFKTIMPNEPPFCLRCGRHFNSPNPKICAACQGHTLCFDESFSVCFYDTTLQSLLFQFKYGRKTLLRHFFAKLMIDFIERHPFPFKTIDLVTVIPLYAARFREREFNQAEFLARPIALKFNKPFSIHNLLRVSPTQFQARLTPKQRFTNLEGAFKIERPLEFKDKNILLIDDVITTGATASQAAKTLKEAGAQKITVLTAAIAE